jgi:hypothetical protein
LVGWVVAWVVGWTGAVSAGSVTTVYFTYWVIYFVYCTYLVCFGVLCSFLGVSFTVLVAGFSYCVTETKVTLVFNKASLVYASSTLAKSFWLSKYSPKYPERFVVRFLSVSSCYPILPIFKRIFFSLAANYTLPRAPPVLK